MFETINLIIFSLSFLSLVFFFFRKMPVLVNLPADVEKDSGKKNFISFKNIPIIKSFSFEILLQKIISRIRILSLKTDHKTFGWLKQLREKNKKNKLGNDNYWEEVRNSKDDVKKKN